jgi:hypothetical protein
MKAIRVLGMALAVGITLPMAIRAAAEGPAVAAPPADERLGSVEFPESGRAAEEAGDKAVAGEFYATLLKNTGDGGESARPELAHAKAFVSSLRLASQQSMGRAAPQKTQ